MSTHASAIRTPFIRNLANRTPYRAFAIAATLGAASLLSACYVVPLQNLPPQHSTVYVPHQAPLPVTIAARLYPSNDLASGYGVVSAVVTNDLNGRGTFSTNLNGESFNGEATRVSGSPRSGVANGAGNRGSFINCSYQMNSSTQGTGSCRLSNGATFSMHVGS